MIWIAAASEKAADTAALEKRLWDAVRQAVPASHLARTEFDVTRPEGLHGLVYNLHLQIQNLRRTRDLLLPCLLTSLSRRWKVCRMRVDQTELPIP